MHPPVLLFVVNFDSFFLSHRKAIGIAAQEAGFDVTIVAKDTGRSEEIKKLGFKFINLPIDSTGMNLRKELRTCRFLSKLYRKEKPDIVHHVGLKLILWGSLASRFGRIKNMVNAVSGLGIMFSDEKRGLVSAAILHTLRLVSRGKKVRYIFQNTDDLALFQKYKVVSTDYVSLIKGAGIDLEDFRLIPEPLHGKVKIIITARMIRDKGIIELIEAAKILKPKYEDKISFVLCGGLDPHPLAIREDYLKNECDGEYISWLGFRTDIRDLLAQSHIVAFPSYYREGIPKSLIEACAIGRPIVTCDSVGCRETVNHGVNGFLVPPRNPVELAKAIELLINNRELRIEMGKESRIMAEHYFSIKEVVQKHLEIYDSFITA